MFKKEKIKPENSLLQPHKESTLEKNQKMRERRKAMIAKQVNKFQKDMA